MHYLHADLIGSTRVITDHKGGVVGTTRFDEYGNRTGHAGFADSAIGYSGNLTDQVTGLVHLRARDYDPATAQFDRCHSRPYLPIADLFRGVPAAPTPAEPRHHENHAEHCHQRADVQPGAITRHGTAWDQVRALSGKHRPDEENEHPDDDEGSAPGTVLHGSQPTLARILNIPTKAT